MQKASVAINMQNVKVVVCLLGLLKTVPSSGCKRSVIRSPAAGREAQ
jgi:hypothetical protein